MAGDGPGGACLVWSLVAPAAELERLGERVEIVALLDAVELERRRAYLRAVDRARFTLAAAILRLAATGREHLDPSAATAAVDRTCPDCGRPHGRPVVAGGPHVSVTHSGDVVAVATSTAGPIGLDVERVPDRFEDLIVATCAPAERSSITDAVAFARMWVRKEAVLKALGVGLRRDPSSVIVTPPDEPAAVVSVGGGTPPAMHLLDVEIAAAHPAALAVITAAVDPPTIEVCDARRLLER